MEVRRVGEALSYFPLKVKEVPEVVRRNTQMPQASKNSMDKERERGGGE